LPARAQTWNEEQRLKVGIHESSDAVSSAESDDSEDSAKPARKARQPKAK
jgi:hypothetical protein